MALTAFDERTARAVVGVLRRAGIDAQLVEGGIGRGDDVDVMVPEGDREDAMRILGQRMEEVTESVLEADRLREQRAAPPATTGPLHDPDDVHEGPPLMMERFASLRYLAVLVMVPLLVVTLAPTIRGDVRVGVAIVLLVVVAVALVVRRRR